MDLNRQIAEITVLENELQTLIQQSSESAPIDQIQRIEVLKESQQKLKYQINILNRAIQIEKAEAEQNDVLSKFNPVITCKYDRTNGKDRNLFTFKITYIVSVLNKYL